MASTLESSQTRLEALALTDPLTGLANHREFQEALAARPSTCAQAEDDAAGARHGRRGSVQAGERRPRPSRRRPACCSAVGPAASSAAMAGMGVDRPAGRRRVRRAAARCPDGRPKRWRSAEAARAADRLPGLPPGLTITCSAGVAHVPRRRPEGAGLSIQVADGALYWAKSQRPRPLPALRPRARAGGHRRTAGRVRRRAGTATGAITIGVPADRVPAHRARPWATRPWPGSTTAGTLPPSWWFAQAHRFGLGPQLEAEAIRVALSDDTRPAQAHSCP